MSANVVNLTTLMPSPGMTFGLDTNIVYWLGYSRATSIDSSIRTRLRPYSAFIAKAVGAGAKFCCTPLNLIEAIHRIERVECKLAGLKPSELKNFRRSQSNRDNIGNEIDSLWATTTRLAQVWPASLTASDIPSLLANQRNAQMDAYDLAIVGCYASAGVRMVISHDHDLGTYDGAIVVVTANQECLAAAVSEGRLLAPDQLP